MRQIKFLNSDGTILEANFNDNDTPDLVGFNKNMVEKNVEEIAGFSVQSKGKNVKIDLTNGEIIVDGKSIDLQIEEEIKSKLNVSNLRWINFNRKSVSYRMVGGQSVKSMAYGIGWQATIDGKTIKRYVLVTREGYTLEKK